MVETARQVVDILGRYLYMDNEKFNTLKDFTLEETGKIHKDMEG